MCACRKCLRRKTPSIHWEDKECPGQCFHPLRQTIPHPRTTVATPGNGPSPAAHLGRQGMAGTAGAESMMGPLLSLAAALVSMDACGSSDWEIPNAGCPPRIKAVITTKQCAFPSLTCRVYSAKRFAWRVCLISLGILDTLSSVTKVGTVTIHSLLGWLAVAPNVSF